MEYKVIGQNIKKCRQEKKLTQSEFAAMLDVSPNYVSAIERGKKMPKLKMIFKIADTLGVNLDTLAGNTTACAKKEILETMGLKKALIENLSEKEYQYLKNIINAFLDYVKQD